MTSRLDSVRTMDLPSVMDPRGVLTSIESGQDIPFKIRRIFYMHGVTADRGGHAHMDTDQVVIAVAGRFRMDLSDGSNARSFAMHDPMKAVFIPRMIFIELHEFSHDAVCLVLADTHYDMKHSIRSWPDYIEALKAHTNHDR